VTRFVLNFQCQQGGFVIYELWRLMHQLQQHRRSMLQKLMTSVEIKQHCSSGKTKAFQANGRTIKDANSFGHLSQANGDANGCYGYDISCFYAI
jgi:predicted transcriptional regulator